MLYHTDIARARKLAKQLRARPTACEAKLWARLRGRQLNGLKFRRQSPIGPYVADFLCFSHHLIVEADGPHHDPVHDQKRDAWLRESGFLVIRFTNDRIAYDIEGVLASILDSALGPHPTRFAGHLLPLAREKESEARDV